MRTVEYPKEGRMSVYRCRWCGRRVSGVWGWFHKPAKCEER